MSNICFVRKGHLGDVLMTEPVARHFKGMYEHLYLASDYPQAKHLIGGTYTGFIPYDSVESCGVPFDRIIWLEYELYPEMPYIPAYARSAGIVLDDYSPAVETGWPRMEPGEYVLLACETSHWARSIRDWGKPKYRELKEMLEQQCGIKAILLESHYGFTEMLSLIRHCRLFIGNDSGPGIIAQCFKKPSLILFGGTDPGTVLFSSTAHAFFHKGLDCIGCKQISRHTEICCASPFCMTDLSASSVLDAAKELLEKLPA